MPDTPAPDMPAPDTPAPDAHDDEAAGARPAARPDAQVYTLLVEVGRKPGDGLPDGSAGAGLLCYAAGRDEAEAVRETVAILKQAGLAPLDVAGHGTLDERLAEGHEVPDEERALMARALAEDAVIVAQMEPVFQGAARAAARTDDRDE